MVMPPVRLLAKVLLSACPPRTNVPELLTEPVWITSPELPESATFILAVKAPEPVDEPSVMVGVVPLKFSVPGLLSVTCPAEVIVTPELLRKERPLALIVVPPATLVVKVVELPATPKDAMLLVRLLFHVVLLAGGPDGAVVVQLLEVVSQVPVVV